MPCAALCSKSEALHPELTNEVVALRGELADVGPRGKRINQPPWLVGQRVEGAHVAALGGAEAMPTSPWRCLPRPHHGQGIWPFAVASALQAHACGDQGRSASAFS